MLNWKRNLITAVLYVIAVILQYGFMNNMGWGVLCPQLLVFFPIFAGILEGWRSGLFCGFISGLIMDMVGGYYMGLWIIVWMVVGFLAGRYGNRFFKENYLLPIISVAVCCTLANLFYAFLIGVVGDYWVTSGKLFAIIGGSVLVNCLLAALFYLPVYRSTTYGHLKRLDKSQKSSF